MHGNPAKNGMEVETKEMNMVAPCRVENIWK
jgi:hypothetical protein